jgi:SAM-dependent methyltransferase
MTQAHSCRHSPAIHSIYVRLAYQVWRRMLERHVGSSASRVSLLECGCGPGFLLRCVERWYPSASVVGLDVDDAALECASLRTERSRLVQASAEDLPFEAGTFAVVAALHVIEHLREPGRFLAEARRVLPPGGLLLIATPNPDGLGARLMGKAWSGWSDRGHISLKPPREWRKMLNASGFRVLEDGTTGLSGIPAFRVLPLALANWLVLVSVGMLPWSKGEAYICAAAATGGAVESARQVY